MKLTKAAITRELKKAQLYPHEPDRSGFTIEPVEGGFRVRFVYVRPYWPWSNPEPAPTDPEGMLRRYAEVLKFRGGWAVERDGDGLRVTEGT